MEIETDALVTELTQQTLAEVSQPRQVESCGQPLLLKKRIWLAETIVAPESANIRVFIRDMIAVWTRKSWCAEKSVRKWCLKMLYNVLAGLFI